MAPTGQADISSLSDQELSDMLKEYGVDVGPINVATRKTYERKLLKLNTGQAAPSSKYTPVDDDEDDEEVILKKPAPVYQTPPPSQARQRPVAHDSHIPTPRGDSLSRPPLSASRKITSSSASTTYSAARSQQSSNQQQQRREETSGGIPAWVKLTALAVVVVLAYLIYTNMEPNAVSQIPHVPNKVEV